MPDIKEIKRKFLVNEVEISAHAIGRAARRGINAQEIREAITTSEIVEDYPTDKYGPSCLLLGFTHEGRALHIRCSYPSRRLVKIITLYEPSPLLWTDHKIRKD